jgi:hypothetical protein
MGRPRNLVGSRVRTVNLDAETDDEANRVDNFSQWVRVQLRARKKARLNHRLVEHEADRPEALPPRRLAALLVNRLNADFDNRSDIDAACADALVAWLVADAKANTDA